MEHALEFCYTGARYSAVIPDTLDLAERAALAINGLGGTVDPALGYTPFGIIHFTTKTPHMLHWATADVTCNTKYGESFPMLRLMSGSSQHTEIESRHRAALLASVEDGLYWDRYTPDRPWRNIYGDSEKRYGKGRNEDFCVVGASGRMLRAMIQWHEVSGDPALYKTLGEMAAAMRRIAIFKDDYCYYPEKGGWGEPCTFPRSGWINTDEPQSETEGVEGSIVSYQAQQIQSAARWAEISGDKDALDLATRLTRFSMKPKFWGGLPDPDREHARALGVPGHIAAALPDPAFTAGHELGHWYSHFHARCHSLRAMLEYGRIAHDERVLEFIRRAYEFSLSQGIPRIGWINCYPGALNMAEGCALGDLVALGIRLSDYGLGDYWDDVDAVVRNQLAEQQLIDRARLERVASQSPEDTCRSTAQPKQITFDNVIERSLGVFGGTSLPTSLPNPWVMLCCTGNGTQGLYYAWEGAVRETGETAQVNLLLNRAAKLLDVDSFLPYEGRVVIRNKAARRAVVRIPWWVNRRDVQADVSGKAVTLERLGNRLLFDDLKPGDVTTLRFPIRETTARYTVNAHTPQEQLYTCTFRGSTLVDISPRDDSPTSYPFYLRDHLRQGAAPMKTVERFVPDRVIRRW